MTRRRRVQKSGLQTHEFPASFGARRFPTGERKALWCARRRIPLSRSGLTRRLRRGWWGCRPEGGAVLSFEAKESTKESWRHGDSRGGPPRFALFANIGVPGTAVPGSCICSGLPVANCLRQLCPLGTRSLSAQASACGSRTVGRPEFIPGVHPAVRPEQSDHVPWADCPQGLSSSTGVRCRIAPYRSLCSPPTLPAGRFGLRPRPHWGHASLRDSSLRSPAGKKPYIAHFDGGARNVARNGVG